MTRPLFQLGSFQFDLPNGVPQTLDWSADYRWEEQGRLLRDPAQQFMGPGSQQITLDGVLYPGFSGRQSTMEQLRTLAREGKPLMLTDGLGKVFGKWAIKQVREGKGTFAPGGGAREISFSVQLVYYAEDNPGQAASPLSVLPSGGLAGSLSGGLATFAGAGSAQRVLEAVTGPALASVAQQAQGAGFSLGQLANIARSAGSGDYVGGALGAFGLAGINIPQGNAWAQLGINGAQMAQQFLQGRGPAATSIGLEALRLAAPAVVQQLGGDAATGLRNMVGAAGTLTPLLNVDPKITAAVRAAVNA
jgi:phage protein U